ncbi:uncharacterized protein si:ch211-191i18.2 [Electrophorus electricus]|uniref:Uncharacterized protein n=1 Tax=Electrophorus electricus TaxID=8005 RepID=A0A4W4G061_ELEEL|nr:uncharacterized protein si:ch211-191i18.2 [Electrophorus electricus]
MPRLPHHCVIAVCMAGSLLLLPLYCACLDVLPTYEYDSTPSPEYDYNATFDYVFYSNGSSEDLEKVLMGGGTYESETDISPTDAVSPMSTSLITDQATRAVYPNVLLTLVLTARHLLRLL